LSTITPAEETPRIVIALPAEDFSAYKEQAQTLLNPAHLAFVQGGITRRESVYNALTFLNNTLSEQTKQNALVLIHDGARPWINEELVLRVIDAAGKYGAACPAIDAVDTFKEKNAQQTIARHLNRTSLAAVQTPQGFLFLPLLKAHRAVNDALQKNAHQSDTAYTDDTQIWDEFVSVNKEFSPVHLVAGNPNNTKITFPKDIPDARVVYRTGFGYDVHPLVKDRPLLLGGVTIPYEKGEMGHSDGDVLLHAITDALLGAAALGDIGSFFPSEDAAWKGADSRVLLRTAWDAVTKSGWSLENIDCVIELEKPKFLPYRNSVCKSIAAVLSVDVSQVFVKAKTAEKLGNVGRGKAVKAWATCLLKNR
jgi:2-C-methyl-D-erythritol 4-phosphate cytidylyltransferase/2-C-methyl-D-erythritol 2,4-cyclodiphosphate synthase